MDPDRRPSIFSAWDLLPAAGLAILRVFYQWVLPRLSDPVPTHFDALGRANGWTAKAQLPWLVFGLPLAFWLGFLVIGTVLAMTQRNATRARVASAQPLRGTVGLGLSLLMLGALAIPLYGIVCIHIGMAAFMALLVLGLILTVRESSRWIKDSPQGHLYRWGLFYVNPEDPRLWVEKRLGIGWTLNYARPAAWWMTLLLLLPAILALGVLFLMRK
jgi:uncharacterized membrane protein